MTVSDILTYIVQRIEIAKTIEEMQDIVFDLTTYIVVLQRVPLGNPFIFPAVFDYITQINSDVLSWMNISHKRVYGYGIPGLKDFLIENSKYLV